MTYLSMSLGIVDCFDLNSSHTVASNPNARRAYENSQHAEDFGRIKLICSFNTLLQSHISA